MNEQKIQNAISLLKDVLSDVDNAPINLKVQLTSRDLCVLRDICSTTISVPKAVVEYCPSVTLNEVKHVLRKLSTATYNTA